MGSGEMLAGGAEATLRASCPLLSDDACIADMVIESARACQVVVPEIADKNVWITRRNSVASSVKLE